MTSENAATAARSSTDCSTLSSEDAVAELAECANGKWQVWRHGKVLRPHDHEWYGKHQSYHQFMFFDSREDALRGLRAALTIETGRREVGRFFIFDANGIEA